MIDGQYYNSIFLLITAFFSIVEYNRYSSYNSCRIQITTTHRNFNPSELLFVAALILIIGLRPTSFYFWDMLNYELSYSASEGNPFNFDPLAENLIFNNLFVFWSSMSLGFNSFMLLMCAINFGCTYAACRRFFPNDSMAAFLVFLGAFSTFSYATNGVKAGTAAGIFMLGLSYYKNWIVFIPLMLASYGFHHSMQLPVAACILAHFHRNPKHYFFGWGLCVLIAAVHITFFQNLFANMSADTMGDARGAGYLSSSSSSDWGGKSGFRLDFILYSAMPVLVGYYAMLKRNLKVSEIYQYILNVYVITNSVWMLCMYAEFTNRIAYLSWLMYPVVLIYPFLRENWGSRQYKIFAKVMLYHIVFTLFMYFVY